MMLDDDDVSLDHSARPPIEVDDKILFDEWVSSESDLLEDDVQDLDWHTLFEEHILSENDYDLLDMDEFENDSLDDLLFGSNASIRNDESYPTNLEASHLRESINGNCNLEDHTLEETLFQEEQNGLEISFEGDDSMLESYGTQDLDPRPSITHS